MTRSESEDFGNDYEPNDEFISIPMEEYLLLNALRSLNEIPHISQNIDDGIAKIKKEKATKRIIRPKRKEVDETDSDIEFVPNVVATSRNETQKTNSENATQRKKIEKPGGIIGRPKKIKTSEEIEADKKRRNMRYLEYSRKNREYVNQVNLDNYYKRKAKSQNVE